MPQLPIPGNVFENLFELKKELKVERVTFSKRKPFSLPPYTLEFEWIVSACKEARKLKRNKTFSEFEDIYETGRYFRTINRVVIEFISDGKHCVLFVNTCPIAQLDVRGEVGLAEFIELPPMSEEIWNRWKLLGGSTVHFEMECEDDRIYLSQVKKEEGMINALQLRRQVDLLTGESELFVSTPKTTLPAEPTLKNLQRWIEVRAGQIDPIVLKHF